ncbi:uncharacterized protein EV422DRAFT_267017 [Fimicolochytrium jonesii]|uniref:uncharacterized protein n=1 Tax=Fimicolochytrium jonesii TaxID=1396493 RepID=UPI0022FDF899|nr:uncharacterized protein EV422DRAFT_267017 [Fimicolochytrium jonesii]KAI8816951.1 hypothetical protein EV422DRAFT_267017 [Fimicolochytrium jonesii]
MYRPKTVLSAARHHLNLRPTTKCKTCERTFRLASVHHDSWKTKFKDLVTDKDWTTERREESAPRRVPARNDFDKEHFPVRSSRMRNDDGRYMEDRDAEYEGRRGPSNRKPVDEEDFFETRRGGVSNGNDGRSGVGRGGAYPRTTAGVRSEGYPRTTAGVRSEGYPRTAARDERDAPGDLKAYPRTTDRDERIAPRDGRSEAYPRNTDGDERESPRGVSSGAYPRTTDRDDTDPRDVMGRLFPRKPERDDFTDGPGDFRPPRTTAPEEQEAPRDNRPPKAASPAERQAWYSDPYHLSARLARLVGTGCEEEALELLMRHQGASTPEVFGNLIAAFGSKRNWKAALHVFRLMEKRNLKPTDRTYTSLFSILADAAAANGDPANRKNRLESAIKLYETLPKLSTIQLNALLKVCLYCINEGGWDLAWELYHKTYPQAVEAAQGSEPTDPTPSQLATTDATTFDIVTFTYMLRLCAERGGSLGFTHALQIWATIQTECTKNIKPRPARAKKPITDTKAFIRNAPEYVDATLFTALLTCFIRAPTKEDTLTALPIIHTWLGLTPNELAPNRMTTPRVDWTVQLLDRVLHIAARINEPGLAVFWYKQFIRKGDIIPDAYIYNTVVGTLMTDRNPEAAWRFLDHDCDGNRVRAQARVVAYALDTSAGKDKVWRDRARDVVREWTANGPPPAAHPADLPFLANLAQLLVEVREFGAACALLEPHRVRLVSQARAAIVSCLEDPLKSAGADGLSPVEPLQARLRCLAALRTSLLKLTAKREGHADRFRERDEQKVLEMELALREVEEVLRSARGALGASKRGRVEAGGKSARGAKPPKRNAKPKPERTANPEGRVKRARSAKAGRSKPAPSVGPEEQPAKQERSVEAAEQTETKPASTTSANRKKTPASKTPPSDAGSQSADARQTKKKSPTSHAPSATPAPTRKKATPDTKKNPWDRRKARKSKPGAEVRDAEDGQPETPPQNTFKTVEKTSHSPTQPRSTKPESL